MRYRNTKTGATLDIKSEIRGGNWQAIKPAGSVNEEVASEKPKRKVTKKKNE